jgi:hypothetical protein
MMEPEELEQLTSLVQDLLRFAFFSPNVPDTNLEAANLVDTTHQIGLQLYNLSKAFTPGGVEDDGNSITEHARHHAVMMEGVRNAICKPGAPWKTGVGDGQVGDLTEAVIYAGQGLHAIADAIERLADR